MFLHMVVLNPVRENIENHISKGLPGNPSLDSQPNLDKFASLGAQ